MRTCDVLIVGGGPAGSSCAWALRDSGLSVLLLDKATFPRNKVCGGWITPFVPESLEIDLNDYARGRTLQPIREFRVSCIGQKEVPVAYDRTVSYGIRRSEFDEYLLRRCGAELHEGTSISKIEPARDGWIVNEQFRTRLLVGAGGHFCPVAFALGPRSAPENAVVAQEIEFEMDSQQAEACKIQAHAPELYFCRDAQGYGWCFRKENFLNIGLGRLDRHKLSAHVAEFAAVLRSSGRIGFDLPQRFPGHAYLLFGYSPRRIVDDNVILIGDSAGLAYSQSGEGIRTAVESGLLAGLVIQLARGQYSRDAMRLYSALLTERFGPKRGLLSAISGIVPRGLRNLAARQLLKTSSFCRRVVIDSWFLREHDTPLRLIPAVTQTQAVQSA